MAFFDIGGCFLCTCYGNMLPLNRWSALNIHFMKNIYDFFNFSWVNFFTQNSADIFKMKQNSQNFITTNILTCISTLLMAMSPQRNAQHCYLVHFQMD